MPPDPDGLVLEARMFANRMELFLRNEGNENSQQLADEAWGSGKRLYRMLRHIPGIHNHEDAPEREN